MVAGAAASAPAATRPPPAAAVVPGRGGARARGPRARSPGDPAAPAGGVVPSDDGAVAGVRLETRRVQLQRLQVVAEVRLHCNRNE